MSGNFTNCSGTHYLEAAKSYEALVEVFSDTLDYSLDFIYGCLKKRFLTAHIHKLEAFLELNPSS